MTEPALPLVDLHRHLEGSIRLGKEIKVSTYYDLPLSKDASLVDGMRIPCYCNRTASRFQWVRGDIEEAVVTKIPLAWMNSEPKRCAGYSHDSRTGDWVPQDNFIWKQARLRTRTFRRYPRMHSARIKCRLSHSHAG